MKAEKAHDFNRGRCQVMWQQLFVAKEKQIDS